MRRAVISSDFPFEIKTVSDDGQIEGLLADFTLVDHCGDRLLPGCLTKSLAARTTPLPMLLHHDLHRPIGAWKEWSEQSTGLFVKGRMTLETRDGHEAHALARDGGLTGLSIGWMPKQATTDDAGARVVSEAVLFEGSLVAVPANDRARVTALKEFTSARDIAEALQDAGMSSRKAKAAAGAAWKFINPDEAELAELEAIVEASVRRLEEGG